MEKQIEEMAKVLCKNYGGCGNCMFFPSCDVKPLAILLHDADYRKASEVAEEIFAEIVKTIHRYMPIIKNYQWQGNLINDLAELKKKFTKTEAEK